MGEGTVQGGGGRKRIKEEEEELNCLACSGKV